MTEILNIGNWTLTSDLLFYKNNEYEISVGSLAESYGDGTIYNWPEHLSKKTWMTELDIYQFNTILLFALDHFDIPLDQCSWKKTLIRQQLVISKYREFNT